MHIENLKLKGFVTVQLHGPDGAIKEERSFENRVVDVGLKYIASRMKDATATAMSHMGVGTSSANDNDTQTALGTAAGARQTLTSTTIVTTNVTDDSVQYVATFAAGVGTGALVEAGIFNDVSTGVMLCRTVFSVINKGADDSLTVTWKVVVA